MKFFKYFGILLLVLIIGFFALGFIRPSVAYDCSIMVDKSKEECWEVLSDETKLTQWIDGFKRAELVSGTKNTVGAVSKMYVDNGGEETMMQETITKIERPNIMAMDFTMDFMDMEYEMTLTEKNGQVEIKSSSVTKGNGMFAKSIVALMPSAMKAQEQKNLDNLKKIINGDNKN